jgi:uncharacterized membrane protein YphA (DoxX/SURF4 family)
MKAAVTLCRIIVGLLFIFSGLVKANDPHGLSYKMQEFFEIWHMTRFDSWTLLLSVLMNAFEIIAGFALLLGWRIKLFTWLLLLLILFFTFLTGYTYITGKPTNCGCFGDCLPISSKTSFLKDVVLTILILFLFWQQNKIKPLFSIRANTILMLLVTLFSFGIQWYALNYLPFVDCLPFKKKNNISEKMKMPLNAIPDSTVITFVYEKNGKAIEFTADKFPADFDSTYVFKSRYDKLIRKGKNNEPPIKGFSLSGITNEDSTAIVMSQPTAVLVFCENFSTPFSTWKADFEKVYASAKKKGIPVYVITSTMAAAMQQFSTYPDVQVFKCDYTAIRTAARVNPTLYILDKGTVLEKWGYKQWSKAVPVLQTRPSMQLTTTIDNMENISDAVQQTDSNISKKMDSLIKH